MTGHGEESSATTAPGKNRTYVESAAFLERVLADASDAIIALDRSQEIVLFNNAAEQMFEFSAAEVLGRGLEILLPERFRSVHRRQVEAFSGESVTRRAMGERGELVGRRKSGAVFPVEVTISKMDAPGRVVFTAIVRDITERRLVEEQRRSESERFRALFQHATDAILVVNKQNMVRFATPSYATLLGYAADDALGHDGFALAHPEDLEGYRRLFAFVSAGPNRSTRYQLRLKHHDVSTVGLR